MDTLPNDGTEMSQWEYIHDWSICKKLNGDLRLNLGMIIPLLKDSIFWRALRIWSMMRHQKSACAHQPWQMFLKCRYWQEADLSLLSTFADISAFWIVVGLQRMQPLPVVLNIVDKSIWVKRYVPHCVPFAPGHLRRTTLGRKGTVGAARARCRELHLKLR